jgi:hypothetical protein
MPVAAAELEQPSADTDSILFLAFASVDFLGRDLQSSSQMNDDKATFTPT